MLPRPVRKEGALCDALAGALKIFVLIARYSGFSDAQKSKEVV